MPTLIKKLFGEQDVMSIRDQAVLSGAAEEKKAAPLTTNYNAAPSTAPADAAKTRNMTPEQLKAEQDKVKEAWLAKRELMAKQARQKAGYAEGGRVNTIQDLRDILASWKGQELPPEISELEADLNAYDQDNDPTSFRAQSQAQREAEYQASIPQMKESDWAPAFTSHKDAALRGLNLRQGLGDIIASPLLITDAAEMALDAVRGVKSPSRFRQGSNSIAKLLGEEAYPEHRFPSDYDRTELGANLLNPVNMLVPGEVLKAAKPLARIAGQAIEAAPRTARNIGRVIGGNTTAQQAAESEIMRHKVPFERAAASSSRGWVGPVEVGSMKGVAIPRGSMWAKPSEVVHTHPRAGEYGGYSPLSPGDRSPLGMTAVHTDYLTGKPTGYSESLQAGTLPPQITQDTSIKDYLNRLNALPGYKSNVKPSLYVNGTMHASDYDNDGLQSVLNIPEAALRKLQDSLIKAVAYEGPYASRRVAPHSLANSAESFFPSVQPRDVADSLNAAYDKLGLLRVPKKLIVPRRSGLSVVTESDISRAMDEGSNMFGLRITPTEDTTRSEFARAVGTHYSPPERVAQLKPFIKRYKNEGFSSPRITAVHQRIANPLVVNDYAAENGSAMAAGLGDLFSRQFADIAGHMTPNEQATLMTKILAGTDVDALLYDNVVEGLTKGNDIPTANFANERLVGEWGTWADTKDPRIKNFEGIEHFFNPSVSSVKALTPLKSGGSVKKITTVQDLQDIINAL